jgi:hypothetical protein
LIHIPAANRPASSSPADQTSAPVRSRRGALKASVFPTATIQAGQVFLHIGEDKVLRLPDQFCVDATGGLVGELRVLLGPGAIL